MAVSVTGAVPPRLADALAERYVLERELGRGGMAVVYLAHDRRHGRPVAVKVLRPELASSLGASRFLREIGIAARLQHPHVLTLIDSGEVALSAERDDTALFYVMPYVAGESLRDRIAREGPLPVAEAVRLLREVVDALAYAHRLGVVHRDVKPGNVLVSGSHALVVDFGIAKAMSGATAEDGAGGGTGALTGTGVPLGTPAYMSPEQALGDHGQVDHRADVYAAGALAYEMLVGRPPFDGAPQAMLAAHVATPAPRVDAARPDVPPALARVVARCLEKDPAARFASADALLAALAAAEAPADGGAAWRPRRAYAAAAVAALALAAAASAMVVRDRRERRARDEAIPAVERLADAGEHDSAVAVARRAEAVLPGDSLLARLWPRISYAHAFRSEPAGARVLRARFDDTTRWEPLGTTPTETVRVSREYARYRFELPGYRPATVLAGGQLGRWMAVSGAPLPALVRLARADAPDADMVYVIDEDSAGARRGRPPVGTFLIDRHEVTNAQYKAFVDAGGYARRELWTEPFVRDGRTLSWAEAMALFVDRTGRPGPATWEAGAPPPGEEQVAVGGVSWYEAMAYARFVGKSLPTVHHWNAAAVPSAAAYTVPGSNVEGRAAARGSRGAGMSPWGAFDMSGNVREWCLTADDRGQRHIPGGSWSEPGFRFTDPWAAPPLDRSPVNGIRLARYDSRDPRLAPALAPVARRARDYAAERPATDAEFATFRRLYDYDPAPLDARVEARDTTPGDWVRERVSFAGPSGERMLALVFLPKRRPPPYQPVVYFPTAEATYQRSSDGVDGHAFSYVMRGGRALVLPVLTGTYERNDGQMDVSSSSVQYRDLVLAWGREMRRTADFVAARPDLDASRLAYLGSSMGGRMGGVVLAVEPRFRAAVLIVAGLRPSRPRPEADPFHFLPRVRVPVLMLNGKYDDTHPVATSQRPFFALLGTPPEHKRYVLYEDGHFVPRPQVISESLAWLDRHLGRAR